MVRRVAIGVQPSFDNLATSYTAIPVAEFEATQDHQPIYLTYLGNINPSDVIYGNLKATISMTVIGLKDALIPLVHAVFGNETTVDLDGDTILDTYKYTLGDPKHLEVYFEDELGNKYGCINSRITSFELSFDIGDVVKASVEILGQGIADTTFQFPSLPTGKPLVTWNTTVTIGGSTYKVREVSLSVDRGISEDSYYVGSRLLDAIEYGESNISGSFSISNQILNEFKRALYGSTTATSPQDEPTFATIEITAKDPSGVDSMTIHIPSAIYPTATLSMSPSEPTGRSFEWRAVQDDLYVYINM